MTDTIDPGDLVRVSRTFLNAVGVAADPTTVVLTVKDPAGTITTPSVVNDATAVGAFYADLTPTVAGVYRYKWLTTGNPQVMDQGSFTVVRDRTAT